jgi:glucose/arabinose dehydrogenase
MIRGEAKRRLKRPGSAWVILATGLFLAGCSLGAETHRLEVAFPALSFSRPVDLQDPGDGSGRLFVVEQAGVIRLFPNSPAARKAEVFLDIRALVDDAGNEEGLLGLAFHPDFRDNGFFYVNYTASGPDRTVIARYRVNPRQPERADPGSAVEILSFEQPFSNHNGGQLAFGPDGYLYIAVGDGGSAGDPLGHAQNRATLLGSLLRIDVDAPAGDRAYGIPPDNPYAGNTRGWREEIFAYGLRNPWRFSFDPPTGRLWVADVGQNAFEEIDLIIPGGNYGWNIMEGDHCYLQTDCDPAGLIPPVWEYGHSQGRSVTGGFVVRGGSALDGAYVYGDFVSGRIWALRLDGQGGPLNELLLESGLNISAFGRDAGGGLYLCAFDGRIYRLR